MYKQISFDYIRGLVDGEGCFTFCWSGSGSSRQRIPTFSIGMIDKDYLLLEKVKTKLGLKNKVYQYSSRKRSDGYSRDGMAILIVRDFGQIKNIIVPLFYKKLIGNKSKQFEDWILAMSKDPHVSKKFKLIPVLYNNGFYDNNFKNYD